MSRRPQFYPPELRRSVLELRQAGKSVNVLATEFSISPQTIANLVRKDAIDGGAATTLPS
jgi:transposase-like protein